MLGDLGPVERAEQGQSLVHSGQAADVGHDVAQGQDQVEYQGLGQGQGELLGQGHEELLVVVWQAVEGLELEDPWGGVWALSLVGVLILYQVGSFLESWQAVGLVCCPTQLWSS